MCHHARAHTAAPAGEGHGAIIDGGPRMCVDAVCRRGRRESGVLLSLLHQHNLTCLRNDIWNTLLCQVHAIRYFVLFQQVYVSGPSLLSFLQRLYFIIHPSSLNPSFIHRMRYPAWRTFILPRSQYSASTRAEPTVHEHFPGEERWITSINSIATGFSLPLCPPPPFSPVFTPDKHNASVDFSLTEMSEFPAFYSLLSTNSPTSHVLLKHTPFYPPSSRPLSLPLRAPYFSSFGRYVVEGEARSTEEQRERERLSDPDRFFT